MADYPARPPTPQAMVHRLPDKPKSSVESSKPTKFVVLISASLAVAGKLQTAKSVADALSCRWYQGDSLHEAAAKAASVGTPKPATGNEQIPSSGANEARYQRMWLSKMTRTGLLFPEESRAAGAGFSGFGGAASSRSSSRRGSSSSADSEVSESSSSISSFASSVVASKVPGYINKPPTMNSNADASPILMVLSHPELESWHRRCIRSAVGEYGIGIIFVPLDEVELPVLKPLDPRTMSSFGPVGMLSRPRNWTEEIVLNVDLEAGVDEIASEIAEGVRGIVAEQ